VQTVAIARLEKSRAEARPDGNHPARAIKQWQKNDHAFFIFPCWIEVANSLRTGLNSIIDHQEKVLPIETLWQKIESLLCNNIA
jgi:hypothetical protein